MSTRFVRFVFSIASVVVIVALGPTFTTRTADAGQQQQQQLPKYSELPVGRVTSPPTEKDSRPPTSIPASETVQGLRILTQPNAGSSTMLSVVGDATIKDASSGMPTTVENVGGCFAQMPASTLTSPLAANLTLTSNALGDPSLSSTARAFEWEGSLMWQAAIWRTPQSPPGSAIVAVHSERVLEQRDGTAQLDSTDAWLDASTRGLRLISKASLPLKQIGSAPGGVRIFVGRDERPDGRHLVQFVVTRAKDTPFAQIQGVMTTRSDGSLASTNACSHHRISLLANKGTAKNSDGGETGLIQFNTILPDLPPGEHSNAIPLPPPTPGQHVKDVRARVMRTHFSVSQTSRDKEPVLAVSASWAGPETNQRVFVPSPFSSPAPVPTISFPSSGPPKNPKMKPTSRPIDPGF